MVNGIDYSEWHPLTDPHLQSDGYTNYDADSLALGKACCKAALQQVRYLGSQCWNNGLAQLGRGEPVSRQGVLQGGAAVGGVRGCLLGLSLLPSRQRCKWHRLYYGQPGAGG